MTEYYKKPMTLYLAIVFITTCNAIIVDWNTNKGPIVPPTTTQRPIPQKPYREPAGVWEDQSNDIPNPNPYVYVLPPPSRPKYNDIDTGYQKPQAPNTNQIISHPNDNKGNPNVPSLTVQYIPNVGNRYVAVVASPTSSTSRATNYNSNNNNSNNNNNNNNLVTNSHSITQSQQQINYNTNSGINNNNNNNKNNNNKWDYIKTNKLDKLNGKYSDKLRKYKSYEKYNTKVLPYYLYVQVPAKPTYYYQQQPQYTQQQPQIQQQTTHYYQQQPQTFAKQQISTSYKSNISKS